MDNKDIALGAGAAGLAATPTLRNAWYKKQHVELGKDNRLLIVTEGGKNSFGGQGHESAAKSLLEAHEAKYGKGTALIVNQNDFSAGKPFSKITKRLYNNATGNDTSKVKKALSSIGFYGAYPAVRLPKRQQMTDAIKAFNPSRVIVTHPDSVNYIKQTGIKPEVAITDYGVKNWGNKAFWNTSRGWVFKNNTVSKAYAPSDDAMNLIKGVDHKRISSIPIANEFFGKKTPLKEFTIWDNDGSPLKTLAIDKSKKLVAISGGSTGADIQTTLEGLLKSNRNDVNYYVVTGKNKELNKRLLSLNNPNVIVQGYDKNWKGTLDTVDMAVLRPHGLTPTEAAARKVPFISILTKYKDDKFTDSYAPHMVGNAKHYNSAYRAPMAAIDSSASEKELSVVFSNALDNLSRLKNSMRAASVQNAAKEIINSPNATFSQIGKISPLGKTVSYGGAIAASGLLGSSIYEKYKNKK